MCVSYAATLVQIVLTTRIHTRVCYAPPNDLSAHPSTYRVWTSWTNYH